MAKITINLESLKSLSRIALAGTESQKTGFITIVMEYVEQADERIKQLENRIDNDSMHRDI